MNNKGDSKDIFIAVMIFIVFLISIVIYSMYKDINKFGETITFSLIDNSEVTIDAVEAY